MLSARINKKGREMGGPPLTLEDLLEKLRRSLKQQAPVGEAEPEVMFEPSED